MRFAIVLAGLLWQLTTAQVLAQSPARESPAGAQLYELQALRALAEQGDKRAAFLLASHYAVGKGVPRDDSEAVRWFTEAAEGGLAEAQYNLGVMYLAGRGVPLDAARAVHWYERAAEQGLAEAQFNLGTLYGTGRGVRRDEALAVKWLSRAAERGLAPAQYNLGALYEHGRGVRPNVNTALEWYRRAAEQGFEQAKLRHAALAKKMRSGTAQAVGAPSTPALAAPSAARIVKAVPGGISGAAPDTSGGEARATDWVLNAAVGDFTVQLASFTSRADAQRFARRLDDAAPVGIYEYSRKGKDWFAVVRGRFVSHAQAMAAVAELPERLRKIKPWVRNFAQIHRQMGAGRSDSTSN